MMEDTEELGTDLYEHHKWVVDKGQSLLRVDKYLSARIEGVSRSRIQSAIETGCVLVNGVVVKSNYRIKPLDEVVVMLPQPKYELEILPEDIALDVVYEDEDVLVVNKAAGMVVHPGHGNYTGTLVNALCYYLRDLPMFRSGEMRPGLVHRIDKDTSGLLVVAKSELGLTYLSRQFFEHSITRRYEAIVWGRFMEGEGTIEGHIGRDQKDRLRMAVYPDGSQGKEAITHYKVLEDLHYLSRVECRLETGRTHQIRVHMAHIGHPLFNDSRYGGDQILRGTTFSKYKQFVQNCFGVLPRQALHARELGFVHPRTREYLHFTAELPSDMTELLKKWRVYTNSSTVRLEENE